MDHAAVVTPPRTYARTLACQLCQLRKVKCDRKFPCATCVRGGVAASCVPSTPAPVRQRRRPAQDLRRRLARCEEMLLHAATAQTPEAPLQNDQLGSSESRALPRFDLRPAHVVVKDENSTRLMDGHLWASLFEELRDMRDIVETQASELDGDGRDADGDANLLLSDVDPSVDVQDLQPDPAHVFRLWQLFLDRVNPLTKIIHVPSVQPILLDAANDICAVPLHYQALLFTIYLMAIVSISADESVQMFGMPKEEALRRYTLGAKTSLIKFNFLKNENMTILQALLFYLMSLSGRCDRYASWLLSGIIVRIAHKMGYHRDGEGLGLPPFETEMRRRIWWQIIVRDLLQGVIGGITSQSLLPAGSDTKEPQNLNDADLFPNSTEAPRPREGPTEMGFCVILYRAHKLMCALHSDVNLLKEVEAAVLGQTLDGKNTAGEIQWTLAKFRDLATSIDAELHALESKCIDPKTGNVHVAAQGLRSMLLSSLIPSLTPIQDQPEWGVEILTPEDNVFKMLIAGHEHTCAAYELLSGLKFEWWMGCHFHPDTLAALIGQLRQRPTGSLSDKGWQVIERTFELIRPDLKNITTKQERIHAQFLLKAWEAREQALVQAGHVVHRPPFKSPEESVTTDTPTTVQQQGISTPLTDLESFFEGYDSSETLTWSSWGDFSAGGHE
ncbi:fungal-specific transcription factor domain-containing protein [Cercophora newfieldiana]|uniref:Fungal-specific transcription factor domain-containing protein n=1 Tax=Cercophora newfieldiana TaxID=92897 RepID=A0AA39Y0P4_9PEZI|nr:fungal-specific transcription factor domain-containing protein [Cercophora newfieldiana]